MYDRPPVSLKIFLFSLRCFLFVTCPWLPCALPDKCSSIHINITILSYRCFRENILLCSFLLELYLYQVQSQYKVYVEAECSSSNKNKVHGAYVHGPDQQSWVAKHVVLIIKRAWLNTRSNGAMRGCVRDRVKSTMMKGLQLVNVIFNK